MPNVIGKTCVSGSAKLGIMLSKVAEDADEEYYADDDIPTPPPPPVRSKLCFIIFIMTGSVRFVVKFHKFDTILLLKTLLTSFIKY